MGSSGGANLTFSEEFNGTSLDASRWHTCSWWSSTTCSIEPNNELELYTKNNVSVSNGMLKLQARRENAVAWNGKTYTYTSGMISSGGIDGRTAPGFTFKYGYMEARLKIPAGQGLWPAFWALPADHSWPPEIDVMEMLGHQPNMQHMNYHYLDTAGTRQGKGTSWSGPDFSAGFHTFGVEWQPDALVWYVDGVERFRFTDAAVITSKPSYLLLNLAVGGDWPGSPNASTAFPSDYLVDYVRVWDRFGTPDTPPSEPVPTVPPSTTSNRIASVRSSKLVQAVGGSTAEGARIVQQPGDGSINQQWKLTPLNGDVYKITSVKSGKVLSVEGGSVNDGAAVIQSSWTGAANQQWRLVSLGSNIYQIVSVKSGKVLDVYYGSQADGAELIQWAAEGSTNQQWQLL